MNLNGNLDLLGGFIKNFALEPVSSWPLTPKVGTFIFKDNRVYICLSVGDVPTWLPVSGHLNTYVHTQSVANNVWVIEHELNATECIVQILDGSNQAITPDGIEYEFNKCTVRFSTLQAGKAVVVTGSREGLARPLVAYEQTFENQQIWVVNHNLGYAPIIRAFVGTSEVSPDSITHSADNLTTTLTFGQAISGRVRCI